MGGGGGGGAMLDQCLGMVVSLSISNSDHVRTNRSIIDLNKPTLFRTNHN